MSLLNARRRRSYLFCFLTLLYSFLAVVRPKDFIYLFFLIVAVIRDSTYSCMSTLYYTRTAIYRTRADGLIN